MENIIQYWNLILGYYDIFHQYISLWALVKDTLLFAFIFLVISIVLTLVCKKWILIDRKYKALKWLGYSYFILIPLWIGFSGAKFGLIHGLQKECKHASSKIIGDVDIKMNDTYLKEHLVGKLTPSQIIDICTYYYFDMYALQLQQVANSNNILQQKFAVILISGVKSKILSEFIKYFIKDHLEKDFHIDKEVTNEILSTEIQDYAKDGLFTKIVHIQIDVTFKGLKKSTFLLMFLVLLVPIAEIGYAFYLKKKSTVSSQ